MQGHAPHRRWLGVWLVVAWAVPIAYALYTRHIWEDFFITFRHSQNLVEGHGLVFEPGRRVHGFTSPLGVLLPALCYLVTGASSYLPALWLFRLLSALAFAGACLLLASLPTSAPRRPVQLLAGLLCLAEIKGVSFTVNGMETGFMLLFLALTLWLDPLRWRALGAAWAGLMWTRPDGFVYVAAYGLVTLAWPDRERRPVLLAFLKAAAVCAALYLPWFAGAWLYYGSPVPHPAQAKSLGYAELFEPGHRLRALWSLSQLLYEAPYAFFGGWPGWLRGPARVLGLLALSAWALPGMDRAGRRASLLALLAGLYVSSARPAPWYLPPVAACGLVALARLPWLPWRWQGGAGRPSPRARIVAGCVAGLLWAPLVVIALRATEQLAWQQAYVETGNRRVIGEWLGAHVGPDERVYLECVGYVGYFSGCKLLDFPGIVTPDVLALRRRVPEVDFWSAIPQLRPEWLLLRTVELRGARERGVLDGYELVRSFDAYARLREAGIEAGGPVGASPVYGVTYLLLDAQFHALRRVD